MTSRPLGPPQRTAWTTAARAAVPFLAVLAVVLVLAVAAGCGREAGRGAAPTGKSPVLLVSIDTLPADRVGCYGCPSVRTPVLDRLARRGIQVRDAVSPAPLTAPSHATMLTGMIPPAHGVRENGMFRLEDDLVTVAEALPAGVRKAAFIGAFPLSRPYNFAQGFELFDDDFGPIRDPKHPPQRRAQDVLGRAFPWLVGRTSGDRPFAWIHLFDPHFPYAPPKPWRKVGRLLEGGGPYEGEVAYTDRELGRFLRRLGGRPTVLVVADHGESLGRHRELTHSLFVYDATQRVPAILSGPDVPALLEVRQRTLVDVAPTLLAAYGLAPLPEHEGDALGEPPGTDEAYLETRHTDLLCGWSPLYGIRTSRWKYVRAPRSELYDLVSDPGETSNLHDARPDVVARLAPRLDAWLAESRGLVIQEVDAVTAERLRALGYLSVSRPGEIPAAAADPKDKVEGASALFLGENAFEARRYEEAEGHLRRAVAADPERKDGWAYLAGTYLHLGRWEPSIEAAERALALEPHLHEAPIRGTLGEALLRAGRPREAQAPLRAARSELPEDGRFASLLEEAERLGGRDRGGAD